LQPGQVVQALVLELVESDVFRLQLPQAIVDVRSDVPLVPGSIVMLAIKGGGANAHVTIYASDAAVLAAAAQRDSVAGRPPIGEAVILARAPQGGPKAAADALLVRDASIVRDASLLSPVRSPSPQVQVTPERALGEAVRVAASRQGGLAPLLADVEQVLQAAQGTVPAPVRAAAGQIAAFQLPLDENLTAADVKQAFQRSGVLFEPRLAAATAELAAGTAAQAPGGDLKAALLVFRQVLKVWADTTAPESTAPPIAPGAPDQPELVRPAMRQSDMASFKQLANALAGVAGDAMPEAAPFSPAQAAYLARSVGSQLQAHEGDHPPSLGPGGSPPPPYRGAPLSAQQPAVASISPITPPHESAERLLAETDGAIARTTLLQAASLPDQPAQRADPAAQRWTFEVPFGTPQGSAVAQFEISRDGHNASPDAPKAVWRARFSLDVEPIGPVHALVALAGERASVTLWAERQATAARLNEAAPMLGEALRAAELEPTDLQFRVGTPPVVAKQAAPGRFMDRAT
jgi:hypothetical protein